MEIEEIIEAQQDALVLDDRTRFASAILLSRETGARPSAVLAALEYHASIGIDCDGTQPPTISFMTRYLDDEDGDVFVMRFARGGGLRVYPSAQTRFSPIPDWVIEEFE